MKALSALFFALFIFTNAVKADWGTDLEAAKKLAIKENKMILLNFAGSDWCIPCIKMKKQVFDNQAFTDYSSNLVLVKADFPRLKKNKLSKEMTKANDALAAKYNKKGSFPLTVLLDAKGNIVKTWDGYSDLSAADFVEQVKKASAKK
jgi:thioredoxin-related protein